MSESRKVVYAGSFSILTHGHLWIIANIANLYDEVYVVVAENPEKRGAPPSMEMRARILKGATSHFPNVQVVILDPDEYVVNFAERMGAKWTIRGIRDAADFEAERLLVELNRAINPRVETLMLTSPSHLTNVRSSSVRGMVGPRGWEEVVSKLVPPGSLAWLISQKHTLWNNLVAAGAQGDEHSFWEHLITPYLEPHRHYHNLEHIVSLLREFEQIKHLLQDPLAVECAIWLHDFSYYAVTALKYRPGIDEQNSADAAVSLIKSIGLSDNLGNMVSQMILATTDHTLPAGTDMDTGYFLDLDMAILGAPKEIYIAYLKKIRAEREIIFPNTYDFIAARQTFSRQLLERTEIFHTSYFKEKYDVQARENLART